MLVVNFMLDGGNEVIDFFPLLPQVAWKLMNLLVASGIPSKTELYLRSYGSKGETSFDSDDLINKSVLIEVIRSEYLGRMTNKVKAIFPANSLKTADKQLSTEEMLKIAFSNIPTNELSALISALR